MLRAVTARASLGWIRSVQPRLPAAGRALGLGGQKDGVPHHPPPAQARGPLAAGSLRALLSGSWTGPACPGPRPPPLPLRLWLCSSLPKPLVV